MIVQWCVKGMSLPDDNTARGIIDCRGGIISNWWRGAVNGMSCPNEIREKLTPSNLDMHVNHYTSTDPVTGTTFDKVTPFISLSAGNVSRDAAARTQYSSDCPSDSFVVRYTVWDPVRGVPLHLLGAARSSPRQWRSKEWPRKSEISTHIGDTPAFKLRVG